MTLQRKIVLSVTFLLAVAAAAASAQQPGAQPDARAQMEQQMQEYMQKYATPGEHHKHLEMLVGSWATQAKFWPAPGAPPMESVGTAENKMVMGGRFLLSSYQGDLGGMPFEGMGISAYDRFLGKYVETWIDSMGTMVLISEGTCDGTGKVRTTTAKFTDPMTQKPTTIRSVYRIIDPDHHNMEMYTQTPGQEEFKAMEITYTRKK
jgi:hypothetical protein